MKKILFAIVLLFGFESLLWSQKSNASFEELATQATSQLTAKYGLNLSQSDRVKVIQLRKLNNLQEIQVLKEQAPAQYQAKLKNIQQGTLGSLRRVLSTPEQIALYDKTQAEVRQQKAAKQKEYLTMGWKPAAVEAALIDIYQE